MNNLLKLLLITTFLTGGNLMAETHEFVFFKFKESIKKDQQESLMETLNICVKKHEGLLSRTYYYSEKSNRWVDHVVWTSLDYANKASAEIMKDPQAGEVFKNIDDKTMVFSHYEKKN